MANKTWMETIIDTFWFDPIGSHSDGTAINTAVVLTPPTGAKKLLIQALTQNIRYTLDGTTPTASKGFQIKSEDPPIVIPVGPNTTITVIEEAATADMQYQWG